MPVEIAIRRLLQEFVDEPFRYLRETTPKVRLCELINTELLKQRLPVDVVAEISVDPPDPRFTYERELRTNRSQMEMEIRGCVCNSHGTTDIVLFKDQGSVGLTLIRQIFGAEVRAHD